MEHIFFEISAVLIVSTVCASIAKLLKQPVIPAYIIAGVLLGPSVLHILKSDELLQALSTFGIAFLLFLVGIELDLRAFLKTSKIAIVTGIMQMACATSIGYMLIRLLGFGFHASFFLALALGFSSTIVAMKMLGERRETDTLYGKIVIGMMLTQDFIAILFLIFFGALSGDRQDGVMQQILVATLKGVVLFSVAFLSSKYLLSRLFKQFARSGELLFLGSICWCLILSMLALALGFSLEAGALLAGVSLSFLPYHLEITQRVKPLRDFFLPIFFAVLGGELIFSAIGPVVIPAVVLSIFVLFGSSIIVILCLLFFGYRARTSLQVGLTIGQVSEFSFVVMNLVHRAGLVERELVSFTALIGLITMTVSVYIFEYTDQLYALFSPLLKKLERKKKILSMEMLPDQFQHHVVLFGHHTMGYKTHRIITALKKPVLVIDHNPDVIQQLQAAGISHLYGGLGDEEVLEKARVEKADYIISTVLNRKGTLAMLDYVKKQRMRTKIIVTAEHSDDAMDFYEHGADFVILPKSISADYLQGVIHDNIARRRAEHLQELKDLRALSTTTALYGQ